VEVHPLEGVERLVESASVVAAEGGGTYLSKIVMVGARSDRRVNPPDAFDCHLPPSPVRDPNPNNRSLNREDGTSADRSYRPLQVVSPDRYPQSQSAVSVVPDPGRQRYSGDGG
jgi:hypothetical protein